MSAQAALYGGTAALEIAGGYFASQNIKETAKLNRDIANMNSEFAALDAYDAEIEGYGRTTRYQKVVDQTISEQRANLAAADVDLNYGSVGTIEKETKFQATLNKMNIEKDAQQTALGFKRQSRDYKLKGNLDYAHDQARASAVLTGSIIKGAEQGLTGYERSK